MGNKKVAVGIALLLANTVEAQEEVFDSIAVNCMQIASLSEYDLKQLFAAKRLARQLREIADDAAATGTLSDLEPTLNGDAAACHAFAFEVEGEVRFHPQYHRFGNLEDIRRSVGKAEQKAALEASRAEKREAADARAAAIDLARHQEEERARRLNQELG
ncbi:hypothetical protein [uncultured Pelagimonas sp.]|uniref:hypothetical protein n=1 Tax=uncultured Pelagimonas sp. TaxID=1618102 RepID=UPI002620C1D5|nr:hypothetical protein [uncultured Pelagimonas sp.]